MRTLPNPHAETKVLRVAKPWLYVFGVDPSEEMFAQAAARNAQEIKSGHVDLRLGTAESLPFADNSFDKAMTINSLQVWTNADAGLRELHRVMKSCGIVAFGFTPPFWPKEARIGRKVCRKRLRKCTHRGYGSGLLLAGDQALKVQSMQIRFALSALSRRRQ